MFPTISFIRGWHSVFLCAAVALFFGVAGTPAMAGGPHDDHGGGGGGGDGGDTGVPALLTMTGNMSTGDDRTRNPLEMLPPTTLNKKREQNMGIMRNTYATAPAEAFQRPLVGVSCYPLGLWT